MNSTISSRRASSFISCPIDHPKPVTSQTRRYSALVFNTPPKQQRISQKSQHQRQPQRSSVSTLTTSAQAKLVVKHPKDLKHLPRRSASMVKRSPTTVTPPAIEDDDDDELLTTAFLKQQRQKRGLAISRRQSLLLAADEEGDESNDTFWKELLDIKSRLKKLEVKEPAIADDSTSSSSCSSSVHTPSSPASPRPVTVHQCRLSEALHLFEQQQNPDTLLAKSMAAVVTEAIAMNQRLWSAATSSPTLDARTLVAMQKSSDTQLKELTESLAMLSSSLITARRHEEPPAVPYSPRHHQHRRSTVTSAISLTSSYYSRYYGQQQQQQQRAQEPLTPPIRPRSSSVTASEFIRPPVKVAGILDYSDPYYPEHQHHQQRPKSYYEPSSTLRYGTRHFDYGV